MQEKRSKVVKVLCPMSVKTLENVSFTYIYS